MDTAPLLDVVSAMDSVNIDRESADMFLESMDGTVVHLSAMPGIGQLDSRRIQRELQVCGFKVLPFASSTANE